MAVDEYPVKVPTSMHRRAPMQLDQQRQERTLLRRDLHVVPREDGGLLAQPGKYVGLAGADGHDVRRELVGDADCLVGHVVDSSVGRTAARRSCARYPDSGIGRALLVR